MQKELRIQQRVIENLKMDLSEKEAEIIRLNIELGDQKRALSPYHGRNSSIANRLSKSVSQSMLISHHTPQRNFDDSSFCREGRPSRQNSITTVKGGVNIYHQQVMPIDKQSY